jgi:hypothetical protein
MQADLSLVGLNGGCILLLNELLVSWHLCDTPQMHPDYRLNHESHHEFSHLLNPQTWALRLQYITACVCELCKLLASQISCVTPSP